MPSTYDLPDDPDKEDLPDEADKSDGPPPKRRGRKPGVPQEGKDTSPPAPPSISQQLPNRKHELFCRFVAEGETYSKAYENAGYTPSTSNASTMANKPEIKARIAVLRKEKEERDLRYQIELRQANLDPDDPVNASREVAEWNAKVVLDLFWENARMCQVMGQYKTAHECLQSIAKMMGLMDRKEPAQSGKSGNQQVGIAIYQDAIRQLGEGGGVSPVGEDNPLAPRISSPKKTGRDG
jgi:hypothetical protein